MRSKNTPELPNPSGLCMCGCGQVTPLATKTNTRHGLVRGHHVRFVPYHHHRRPRKPNAVREYICHHCHNAYRTYRSHAEIEGKQGYYCSHECKSLSQIKHHPTPSDIDRFWSKVDKSGGDDSCWLWTATLDSSGYGKMAWPGKNGPYRASRIAFWIAHGREANGMVLHSCDTPSCVNPAHLSEGTQSDNMSQAATRGRTARGERNGAAKLTADDVTAIRARYKRRHPVDGSHVMAREYGVSQAAIMNIVKRKSWKHVP